jgi:hypothetical protein
VTSRDALPLGAIPNQELEDHATALAERIAELSSTLERCIEENEDLKMRSYPNPNLTLTLTRHAVSYREVLTRWAQDGVLPGSANDARESALIATGREHDGWE